MRVLIVGGAGHIGTNLNLSLTEAGHEVFIIDKEFGIRAEEISQAFVRYICPDSIVHLAALASVKHCEKHPKMAVIDNVMTAYNIFAIAKNLGIPVTFTSSQAAVGMKTWEENVLI